MRDERKKQARSNKQTRQSNTAHPRQSLFLTALGGTRTHDTLYSRQSAHMYIHFITPSKSLKLDSTAGLICYMSILTCMCTSYTCVIHVHVHVCVKVGHMHYCFHTPDAIPLLFKPGRRVMLVVQAMVNSMSSPNNSYTKQKSELEISCM